MIEINVTQGSPEWLKLKLGKIGGTRVKDVKKADNLGLVDILIAEIDSEQSKDFYKSGSMDRGTEQEPTASLIYQAVKEHLEFEAVGFCQSEWNDYLVLSPDLLTKDRVGGAEFKCPDTATHVRYIRQNLIPVEYRPQIYAYFLVNEKQEWMDFVSFDDRFKSKPMFIKRVYRNEIEAELLETKNEIISFTKKLEKYYKQVIT